MSLADELSEYFSNLQTGTNHYEASLCERVRQLEAELQAAKDLALNNYEKALDEGRRAAGDEVKALEDEATDAMNERDRLREALKEANACLQGAVFQAFPIPTEPHLDSLLVLKVAVEKSMDTIAKALSSDGPTLDTEKNQEHGPST